MEFNILDRLDYIPQEDIDSGERYVGRLVIGEARRMTKEVRTAVKIEIDGLKYQELREVI